MAGEVNSNDLFLLVRVAYENRNSQNEVSPERGERAAAWRLITAGLLLDDNSDSLRLIPSKKGDRVVGNLSILLREAVELATHS